MAMKPRKTKRMMKGGAVSEYGGKEKYASKKAMMKHEKGESKKTEMKEKRGMRRGGMVEKSK